MTNRLINETSPYLLQHAHNPVDWYPWGDEALARALQEDKPVLLSIGYSACHWCHVMERECFENHDIARFMNENFINIKVDREERPDLDAIYMQAVQAITGSGGWPLTVFLTPQKKPFYGGTYFPPEDRGGLPGLPRVLQTVAEAYRSRKGQVESSADQIIAHLNQSLKSQRVIEPLTTNLLSAAYASLESTFDTENGGFGTAPKFPQPMTLEFLLRYHHRTGDRNALSAVELTLDNMAKGGIYDQLGGGFHRYSVDSRWLVPHFEKMLYDNALLSRLYLHAYQVTCKKLYLHVVEETLDYVLREMTDKDGGFYSAQDADSEGIEGKYYTWTLDELVQELGVDEGKLVSRYFGVTERGNFDGVNILNRAIETEALASTLGVTPEELQDRIDTAKVRLLKSRVQRVPPHRDEKILADWNGLMLASFAEAASVLDRKDYLEAAISNAAFLTRSLYDGLTVKHAYKDGHAPINGFLLDYALLCNGLLALYQATFQDSWLRIAQNMGGTIVDQFWDESNGVFYDTGYLQEKLVIRPRTIADNTLPSGSSAAAFVLLHLARLTNNKDYERIAATGLRGVQDMIVRYPSGFGHWLCALDFYLSKPIEVAVIGRPENPVTKSLMSAINLRYIPNKVLAGRDPDGLTQSVNLPLFNDRGMIDNCPTAYVCSNHSCHSPVTDPGALSDLLDRI